ncbi:MAG: hypothetical protein ACLVJ6_01240 [Merdibacter sp.]
MKRSSSVAGRRASTISSCHCRRAMPPTWQSWGLSGGERQRIGWLVSFYDAKLVPLDELTSNLIAHEAVILKAG